MTKVVRELAEVLPSRHSGQAKREPESRRLGTATTWIPGLLSAGVTFFRGNDDLAELQTL